MTKREVEKTHTIYIAKQFKGVVPTYGDVRLYTNC